MSQPATRGLGRGLGELFARTETPPQRAADPVTPDAEASAAPVSQTPEHPVPEGSFFAELALDAIRANPKQPRTVFDEDAMAELVESIHEVGLLQPIVVRPIGDRSQEAGDGDAPGDGLGDGPQFELVMGERRWRAARQAGLLVIPAIVRETEQHDLLRDALLENLHRAQLNPLEEAAAYQQMLEDFGCTQEELASRIKRSRPQISNTIRLLRLPPTVQRRVAAGVLSAGHARALLVVDDPAAQERLAQRVVAEGLSVRATEELVTLGETGSEEKAPRLRSTREVPERATELADELSRRFDTRVRVDVGRSKGKLTVDFASLEDLERIVALIR